MTDEAAHHVSAATSATCTTCHRLRACAIFYLFLYLLDICSDLVLSWHYYYRRDFQESVTTLIFVCLPLLATLLANCLEENLRVDVSRGCVHYIGFLPPRSKWKKFELHKKKHRVEGDEDAMAALEQQCKFEEINAVILEDIMACFESAPQLIFQLSIVFRDMATFDGDLQSSITWTNAFKLISIFSSTFSVISALYLKIENKTYRNREEFVKERRLGFMGVFSRVSFLLCYASMCVVSYSGVGCLAAIHGLSVFLWLMCSRPSGYHNPLKVAPLALLEALLHIFQYTTWSSGRDAHNTIASLALSNVLEWLVFFAGFMWICVAPVQRAEFIMYKVGFGTHLVLFVTSIVVLLRFYIRIRRSHQ